MIVPPRALRTEQTMAFLREVLRGRRRVLEVGCGRGDARGAEVAAYVLAAERRGISEGRLVPIGLRIVAERT